MRRLIPLGLVLAAVAGFLLLRDTVDPVAEAGSRTATITSEVEMQMSMTANFQSLTMSGRGAIDPARRRAALAMHLSVPGEEPVTMDEIIDGTDSYLRSRAFGTSDWLKFDLQREGEAAGIDAEQLLWGKDANDPTQVLNMLRGAGRSRKLGRETIRGMATTHWRAAVDFRKAVEQTGGVSKQAAELLAKLVVGRTVPVDVWIDDRGYVRREHFGWDQRLAPGSDQVITIAIKLDFMRFDVPVDVRVPGEVIDPGALGARS